MDRFVARAHQTPAYREAVRALQAVVAVAGPGVPTATQAFAEAVWEQHKTEYAASRGLTESKTNHACIRRLLGRQCRSGGVEREARGDLPPCWPPGADHSSLWNRDGKPVVFVMQPYPMSYATVRELVDFCERWGLQFSVSPWPSWHYPGAVVTLEITRTGTDLRPARQDEPPA